MRKGKISKTSYILRKALSFMLRALLSILLLTPILKASTVIVDEHAQTNQKPIVQSTANGITQVDIQTPSSGGVSHNKYKQFDVSKEGLILNNSKQTSKTQLAGYVKGNDYLLKSGEASIILNEINARDVSRLSGYIEVAGKKAQVVIANAAGITCDGCGFINANRATLTTGAPIVINGMLDAYLVNGGQINVIGKGLDSSSQDYTDLIARSVKINASLWGNAITAVSGKNRVSLDLSKVEKLNNEAGESKPEFGIDVAALGGMYAGKIKLIGTEHGVGVHNAGSLGATSEGISITVDGRIVNAGQIGSKSQLEIKNASNGLVSNEFKNQGLIDGSAVSINSDVLTNLDGAKIYGDELVIASNKINNLGGSDASPIIGSRGNLQLSVNELNNKAHGLILSQENLVIKGNAADKANAVNNHSATIESHGDAFINAEVINNIDDNIEVKHDVLVKTEKVSEWAFRDSPNERYKDAEVEKYCVGCRRSVNYQELKIKETGKKTTRFLHYIYDREIYESQIIKKDPAKIISGRNLTFNVGKALNKNSQIIAGARLLQNIEIGIDNQSEPLFCLTSEKGEYIETWDYKEEKSWYELWGVDRYYSASQTINHTFINKTSLDLGLSQIKENQANTNTNTNSNDLIEDISKKRTDIMLSLPKESLYKVSPSPEKGYVIETDPSFIDKRNWLSSDYMFNQLQADPTTIQKRLGDGYYEQKLIREQVTKLTGQRYLGDYRNDNEQYASLITNAVEFSKQHQLRIGVELTDEQMRALTTDIVWMVSKEIEVGGVKSTVLVPKVYVAKEPIVTGDGALISGREVMISSSGTVSSSGTITGKNALVIDAENIENEGTLQGGVIGLNAKDSITSSGAIDADMGLSMKAAKDVNLITKTNKTESKNTRDVEGFPFYGNSKQDAGTNSNTVIDRTSVVRVRNGNLDISAGNNITSIGALIENLKEGAKTSLSAGKNINLLAAVTERSEELIGSNGFVKFKEEKSVGTSINTKGNIHFKSGGDLLAKGANIQAGRGEIDVDAENVYLHGASNKVDVENHLSTYDDGFFSSSEHHRDYKSKRESQEGSTLVGGAININARKEAQIKGGNIAGSGDVNINADKVTIGASENYYYEQERNVDKKSGLMAGDGFGIDIGTKKERTDNEYESTVHQGSMIVAGGHLNVNAKKDVLVEGSTIGGYQGTHVEGANVHVVDVKNSIKTTNDYSYEKTGLSLSLTGTPTDIYNESRALREANLSKNKDIKRLQKIKSGLVAAGMVADALTDFEQFSIGVSASFGTEKRESHSESHEQNSVGSHVFGNNISFVARGDENGSGGDVNVVGSHIGNKEKEYKGSTKSSVSIDAKRDFNLLAGQNSKRSHSDESSYSASVGASASVGVNGAGYGLNANGSIGFGNGNKGSTTWTQSTIDAASFTLKTGGNANITGSAVKSDKVKAKIGGDLTVTSLQDEHYHNKKNDTVSIGGSYGTSGVSVNGSYSQDRTNSGYSSVTNQAGIFAGNEGFDIDVGGKTTLTGAVIASSAEDKSKNRLSTQTISYSDITNKADYSVNSFSAGAGYGTGGVNISAPSTYHHGDDDASKTKSAVEMGALIVRDEQNQTQLVSELSHDTKGAHKELKQIFDEEKELERKRTLALVSEAAQQAKTFKTKYDKVEKKYANTDNDTNNQGNKNQSSGTGSTFNKRVDQVASIVTGIITGDVGSAASGVLAPEVANLIKRATYKEDENGNQKMAAANILAHAAGGAALAGIAGGDVLAGAGAAAGGEIIADIVRNQLYAGKTNKELTEAEKQNISNISQLLTAVGAGLVSDNDGKAITTAVTTSKNAVENNFFSLNGVVEPGAIQIAEVARSTEYELRLKCGDECTKEEIEEAYKKAGLRTYNPLAEEQIEAFLEFMYNIPVLGQGVGIRMSISEKSITPLANSLIHLLKIGFIGKIIFKGGNKNLNPKDRIQHEKYKDELRAKMEKPYVKDAELEKIVDRVFRENAKIGNGSTGAAIRYEQATGKTVEGRFHTKKTYDMINKLQTWLKKNPTASSGDRAAAENMLRDLQNALKGK